MKSINYDELNFLVVCGTDEYIKNASGYRRESSTKSNHWTVI